MANKNKSKLKDFKNFEDDYAKIVTRTHTIDCNKMEWLKRGDTFYKFTLYKEYTPVKTSCDTTLLINKF